MKDDFTWKMQEIKQQESAQRLKRIALMYEKLKTHIRETHRDITAELIVLMRVRLTVGNYTEKSRAHTVPNQVG